MDSATDKPKLRVSVRNLKAAELHAFREAFGKTMAIRDNRGFTAIAGFHGTPDGHCPHWTERRIFLPWHRAYLHWLEVHIQDHDPNVTLPWWNWASAVSHAEGLPAAYTDDTVEVDGETVDNVLARFRVQLDLPQGPVDGFTFRDPGDPARLPFPHDTFRDIDPHDPDREVLDIVRSVDDLMAIDNFVDFSNVLQDVHDSIHGWIGGVMGIVAWAAFDPIFWAHHCMVDRLWWMWQNRHGNATVPGEMLDMPLVPFGLTVADVLDSRALGVDYAGAVVGG